MVRALGRGYKPSLTDDVRKTISIPFLFPFWFTIKIFFYKLLFNVIVAQMCLLSTFCMRNENECTVLWPGNVKKVSLRLFSLYRIAFIFGDLFFLSHMQTNTSN